METIVKKDSNGSRLSLEILNGKLRVSIGDEEIGLSVDLDKNECKDFVEVINRESENIE